MKLSTLAYEIDVSTSTLYRIEMDQINVTLEKLYKIARVLNVSMVDLIDEKYLGTGMQKRKTDDIENRYILFLKHQNELLQKNLGELREETTYLVKLCSGQDANIKLLLSMLSENNAPKKNHNRKTNPRLKE